MEYRIKAYVDELFEKAPKTQQAYEIKLELVQNLLDKYHAMVSEGISEEEAFQLTILNIGDMEEVFAQLSESPGVFTVSGSETFLEKKRAALTAAAIMMYILSVVPLIVLSSLGVFEVLGVILLLCMVAGATGLLVYSNMTKPKTTQGPEAVSSVGEGKGVDQRKKQLLKAFRSAYWPLVLALYFLLSFLTGRWGITWIIFLIAPALETVLRALLFPSDK